MKSVLLPLILFLALSLNAQDVKVSSGKVVRHAFFNSEYVDARTVDVWLPNGYSKDKQYAVLYMHDGQMLFDARNTWNKQEWGVDEVMTTLMSNQRIRDCIVVGIWNNAEKRHAEYFPQRGWKLTPSDQQKKILEMENVYINPEIFEQGMLADRYLRFIVRELKPYIDKTYSTKADKANTFIMGSSMGGLISCYAICEYPGIFEGAICMSTHWPAADGITINYLKHNLPNPRSHRFYFDYGTATLDSLYEPYQLHVDSLLLLNGYTMNKNLVSKKFEGAEHTEAAWRERLHIPLELMLKE
ncbi:alpha/beta hydrolase [Carboxylicivirga sp. A043]|uniref:alpha/beta hydrolase n=1 Tax=Carboxylicivirga litoralis TaxID=2816963 RepID=UPI0021CB7B08|nr:alpha/beta hydrolase-fold protein [Carboxylicivirga sp. A043]MCU4154895.1 alpha/beta hydrolase [Carboxylicivirga sp. A043]